MDKQRNGAAITQPGEYVEVVEELLQTPFFQDEREELLHYAPSELATEDIEKRATAYIQGLRILAGQRIQERAEHFKAPPTPSETKAWNEHWSSTLTIKRIGALTTQHKKDILLLSNKLSILNSQETEGRGDELFPLQEVYAEDILQKLQLPPQKVPVPGKPNKLAMVQGVTAVGPTGVGKTAIMGHVAHRLEVGKEFVDEAGETRTKRMLIVAPSIELCDQLAGIIGDRTFARFAQDVSITPYHSKNRNIHGATMVTTPEQFVAGFKDGKFFGMPIDILTFDEVHHITEPQTQQTFLEQWRGPTLGFTATPDYHEERDVRSILPYTVTHLDPLSSIEAGITNGAQLFTVMVDGNGKDISHLTPRERTLLYKAQRDDAIIDFLGPLLADGRRAMIICDSGGVAASATRMADRLSEISLMDGRQIVAEAIHSALPLRGPKSTKSIVQRFHERKVDVLTSVGTGIEGFNADIDVVVFNSIYSFLKLRQLIGRGTRPSARFPVTIYAQFLIPELRKHRIPYSHYQAFGLERIEQGKVITGTHASLGKTGQKGRSVSMEVFPPHLREYMDKVNYKTYGEVVLGDRAQPDVPPGYISFDEIYRPASTSATMARERLTQAGFEWFARYEKGRQGMIRYYPESARNFFRENYLPGYATEDHISLNRLADRYGIRGTTMRKLAPGSGLFIEELNGGTRPGLHIHKALIPLMDKYINEALPLVTGDEMTTTDLAAETDTTPGFLYLLGKGKGAGGTDIVARPYRNPDGKASSKHPHLLSKAEADILRDAINAFPQADDTDKTKTYMVKKLGVTSYSRLHELLTEVEKEQLAPKWMRLSGKKRLTHVWTEGQAADIEKRFREEVFKPLPPHLVPMNAAAAIFATSKAALQKRLSTEGFKHNMEKLPLGMDIDRLSLCIPWDQLERLMQFYLRVRPDAPHIDFSRLPHGPEDDDPDRIDYARHIQTKLKISKDILDFDPKDYAKAPAGRTFR